MSVVLAAYRELREGRGHAASIRALSRRYGLDQATVSRVIRRAERVEEREPLRACEAEGCPVLTIRAVCAKHYLRSPA